MSPAFVIESLIPCPFEGAKVVASAVCQVTGDKRMRCEAKRLIVSTPKGIRNHHFGARSGLVEDGHRGVELGSGSQDSTVAEATRRQAARLGDPEREALLQAIFPIVNVAGQSESEEASINYGLCAVTVVLEPFEVLSVEADSRPTIRVAASGPGPAALRRGFGAMV